MQIKKVMAASLLAVGLTLSLPAAAAAAALPDFTQLVESEGKAVVNISTRMTVREAVQDVPPGMEGDPFFEFFRRFAPPRMREFQGGSFGSGFIISADGYVMTNAHVIARADEVTVTLTDKREYKAKVIGSDARTDVALLKIDAKNLPVVNVAKGDVLKVGEWVVAIGSPFGFDNSVTAGIVSAKGRQLPDESYVPFIQTDVAVNPGNSGGPLFNMRGEVVGINSQIFSKSGGFMGISFAIPIDVALNITEQLKSRGKVSRGRIGVAVQELSKPLADSFGLPRAAGALINGVEKGGPADKAGVRVGDVVLKINGTTIEGGTDLQRVIGAIQPGNTVQLEVWRNRVRQQIAVKADELKDPDPRLADREYKTPERDGSVGASAIGLSLQELNPAQLKKVGVPYGLLVRRVNTAAARAGVAAGDVIVGIAGEPLKNAEQFKSVIAATKKGGVVALQVWRQGTTLFVPVTIGGGDEE